MDIPSESALYPTDIVERCDGRQFDNVWHSDHIFIQEWLNSKREFLINTEPVCTRRQGEVAEKLYPGICDDRSF